MPAKIERNAGKFAIGSATVHYFNLYLFAVKRNIFIPINVKCNRF